MRHRLETLLTRIAAGWLPRPRPVATRRAATAEPSPAASNPDDPPRPHVGPPPVARWPRGRACLVRVVGYQAAGYGSQLEHLLADPAMAEIVAKIPSFGRMLRPLCRVLGISPPVLGFPPPPPPRPAKPARQPREKPSAITQIYEALALTPAPAPQLWDARRRYVLPGSA
jgi:hypothetical protein